MLKKKNDIILLILYHHIYAFTKTRLHLKMCHEYAHSKNYKRCKNWWRKKNIVTTITYLITHDNTFFCFLKEVWTAWASPSTTSCFNTISGVRRCGHCLLATHSWKKYGPYKSLYPVLSVLVAFWGICESGPSPKGVYSLPYAAPKPPGEPRFRCALSPSGTWWWKTKWQRWIHSQSREICFQVTIHYHAPTAFFLVGWSKINSRISSFWQPQAKQLPSEKTKQPIDRPVKIPAESVLTFFVRKWCQPPQPTMLHRTPDSIAGHEILALTFHTNMMPPPS